MPSHRVAAAIIFTALASPVEGTTLRVPSEYPTINQAMDSATSGDSVLVAAGTYDQHETRLLGDGNTFTSVVFLKSGVLVRSEDGAGSTVLRLDGNLDGPTVIKTFGMSGLAIIEGFTITGSSPGIHGLQFTYSGRCIIRECIFRDLFPGTQTTAGAGSVKSDMEIYNCIFENITGGGGGAVGQASSTLVIEDCEFRNIRSGAVELINDPGIPHPASLAMRRCNFFDNEKTTGGGGAVAVAFYSDVLIEDSWFENNRSIQASSSGGAIQTAGPVSSDQVIRNCTFIGNYTDIGKGGAIRVNCRTLEMIGNTFFENSQGIDWSPGGSAVYLNGGTYIFRNNAIVSSNGDQAVGTSGGVLDTGCNVYWNNPLGHTSGFLLDQTDLVSDPFFCDANMNDFSVNAASPCLPWNNPNCKQLIGAWGQGCGAVSVNRESWGQIKSRYRGNPVEEKP